MRVKTVILLLFVVPGYLLQGQGASSPFLTKTYTSQDGLPHSYIYEILQDNSGYLWINTRYGLCRFDGQHFSNITFDGEVKNIPLGSLTKDPSDRLCILSGEELYYPDTKQRVRLSKKGSYFGFQSFTSKGTYLSPDFWTFSEDGIYALHGDTTRCIPITPQVRNSLCRLIIETDSGYYYNLLNDFFFLGNDGKFIDIGELFPESGYVVVMGLWDGEFYVYTNRGIYAYRPNNLRTLYQEQLEGEYIYAARRDRRGRMWVGTADDGVMVSQPEQEEMLSYTIKLSHTLISGFYEDNEENMWIAGFEGLTKVSEKKFESYSAEEYPFLSDLNHSTKDKNGVVYFFSEKYGISSWELEKFDFQSQNTFTGRLVDASCLDEKNRFWCITRLQGLIFSDPNNIKDVNDTLKKSVGDLQPTIVYDDHRKKIWIAGETLMSGDEHGFTVFTRADSPPVYNPLRIVYLRKGRILVTTIANELLLIDQLNILHKVKTPITFQPNKVYRMFSDSSENIWISYPGNGLLQCRIVQDSNLEIMNAFNTEEGLTNDFIQSFETDQQGRLWLSTMAGVAVLDFKNRAIKDAPIYLFGREEGIQASGLEYGRLLCDNNGDMWYSTQNALMRFKVSELTFSNTPPFASIENVRLHNRETHWNTYTDTLAGVFQIPVDPVLHHKENTLSISYKAATMRNADNVQYSYLLSGINNYWSHKSKNTDITFSNLRPGKYTFFVRSTSNGLDWSGPALFRFTILEPFWQQWWFRTLLSIAIATCLYIIYLLRIRQLQKEKQIRDQIARDLHDDIGSTLNSVKVYANVALLERDNVQYLEKIKETIQEAITTVRDIVWVLDEKRDTVEDMITRLSQFGSPVCLANQIHFIQQMDHSLANVLLGREEKRNLFMILKEAINNSIKYAECRTISLIVSRENNKLTFQVSDDGKGYTTDALHEGHGLKNMRRRSEEIHYTLQIYTEVSKGTQIKLEKL